MAGSCHFPSAIAPLWQSVQKSDWLILIDWVNVWGKSQQVAPSPSRSSAWSSTEDLHLYSLKVAVWRVRAPSFAHTCQRRQHLRSPETKIDDAVSCQEPRSVILLLQIHLRRNILQEGAESGTRHAAVTEGGLFLSDRGSSVASQPACDVKTDFWIIPRRVSTQQRTLL